VDRSTEVWVAERNAEWTVRHNAAVAILDLRQWLCVPPASLLHHHHHHLILFVLPQSPAVANKRRATAYKVPVAVLTFKVIQGRWFLSHLKRHMRFLVINSNLVLVYIFYRLATKARTDLQNHPRSMTLYFI